MTEVLKNIALAAGAFYLVYRIYSSYVRPILSLWRGKSRPRRAGAKQPNLLKVPQQSFVDVR
ncbi:MAG: hypothetical protein JXN61_16960 [Sedimentisphaerales bacterium]|nr:hypothetical protein [Sedimentisphaerales bacterium]